MKKCKKCLITKETSEFYKHKGICKECHLQKSKEWRVQNKDRVKEVSRNLYLKHKDARREPRRIYIKEKRKNDPLFSIASTLRNNIRNSFLKCGFDKSKKTEEIIGCSFEEFQIYLESKFEIWMNWENKGKYNGEFNYGWDIDHIKPISSAKTEDEVIRLNHYTNLQPLCSKINRDIKKDSETYELSLPDILL
jgi:hypothetical protein